MLALRDSPELFERLSEASGSELQIQAKLRQQFPDSLVRAAITLQELRTKALTKFVDGNRLWLDRIGLEQCTGELVAAHKAARFSGRVWDYCSGMGSDAAALAARGCDVFTVDIDPLNSLRTRWNSVVLSRDRQPFCLCARVEDLTDRSGLLHVDPDRRVHHAARAVRIEDYEPRLEQLQRWTSEFEGGAIKLSPAANFGGKFPTAEIELVSVHGECKEAIVWFGSLAGAKTARATALPAGESLLGDPMEVVADIGPLKRYLFDPDPAIVRSGLVDVLADQLGLARLDPAEEYLTGDTLVSSAFVRAFDVQADLPNNPKEIRAYFRTSHFGQLEIKCRHIPVDVDRLRKQLTLPGDQPGVLIIARIEGKARGVVARRVS